MAEFKDRELRKYNEMSDKEKALNTKPLQAYETMDPSVPIRSIPGIQKLDDKEDYRRYARKGIQNPAALQNQAYPDYGGDSISRIGNDYMQQPKIGGSLTSRDMPNR